MCTIPQPILPCPLCCQPNFSSVDSLRTSLVSVTKRPLMCPICSDILLGLDKLTIHLFGHSIQTVNAIAQPPALPSPPLQQQRPSLDASPSLYLKIESEISEVVSPLPIAMDEPAPPQAQAAADSLKMVRRRRPASSEPSSTALPPTTNAAMSDDQAQCYICGYTFRSKEVQRMHLRLVHEIATVDTCGDAPTTLGAVGASPLGSRFHCDYCPKYFKMKGSLRLHLRVVHGVFGVAAKAATNQKGSDGECSTIAHAKDIERDLERLIQPPQLTTSPSNESIALNTNASATEMDDSNSISDAKLWECDTCAKSFTTKYFLKKHKRLHTGELVWHLVNSEQNTPWPQHQHQPNVRFLRWFFFSFENENNSILAWAFLIHPWWTNGFCQALTARAYYSELTLVDWKQSEAMMKSNNDCWNHYKTPYLIKKQLIFCPNGQWFLFGFGHAFIFASLLQWFLIWPG